MDWRSRARSLNERESVATHVPATMEFCVMKNPLAPVGALLVLIGALWTLQGLDIIGGSGMSGETLWAVIGPIVAVVGLGLIVTGIRSRKAP